MASPAQRIVVGSFVGTGALKEIHAVGFRPQVVRLLNVGGLVTAEWVEGMADATAMKRVTAGDLTLVASPNGITPLSDGFSLGVDGDLNVNGELVRWEAIG
jgi:hypothetical protein